MKQDKTVVAIVAGVSTNIGFTEEKRKQAGKQFVDVGIAEEHAVAMASGIAKNQYLQHTQALCKELMTNYHKTYV